MTGFDLVAYFLATRWADLWSTGMALNGVPGFITAFLCFYICRHVARPYLEQALAQRQMSGLTVWNWLITATGLLITQNLSSSVQVVNFLSAFHSAFLFSVARLLALAMLILSGFLIMNILGKAPGNPTLFILQALQRLQSTRGGYGRFRQERKSAPTPGSGPTEPKYKPEKDDDNQGPIIDV